MLIITCWPVSQIFSSAINTLKQSVNLTNTSQEKLKLNTLDCYEDEDLTIRKEISCLLINLEEIIKLPSIFSGYLYPAHMWKAHPGRFVLLF